MKRLLLPLIALGFVLSASAQQEAAAPYWTTQGLAGINMSQVSLSNWAAGGDGSIAFDLNLNYSADYKRGRNLWQNRLELAYGLNNTETNGTRKTNDKIYLSSQYGYQVAEHWYLTLLLTFQTQFAKGYDYSTSTENYISRFMSPGYLTFGPGISWTPNDWFSANFSPASWRGTFVLDDKLSDEGAFGVDPGKHLLNEFGGSLTLEVKKDIMENMALYSRLNFFSNYLDKPQNVDIRWDTQLNMKINKWFSANLALNLIYDDDVKIAKEEGGKKVARLQLKEILGIGLQANF